MAEIDRKSINVANLTALAAGASHEPEAAAVSRPEANQAHFGLHARPSDFSVELVDTLGGSYPCVFHSETRYVSDLFQLSLDREQQVGPGTC